MKGVVLTTLPAPAVTEHGPETLDTELARLHEAEQADLHPDSV